MATTPADPVVVDANSLKLLTHDIADFNRFAAHVSVVAQIR